jgi:TPP-dependent pyruvate/acetoin dehydrogenase alpha subunit
MPNDKLAYYKAKDPLILCKSRALSAGRVHIDDLSQIETDIRIDIEEAVQFACESGELPYDNFANMVKDY